MSSGTQPDSPVGEWQAVFVDDPTRNRPVSAPEGEHFPPEWVDGFHLIAANHATWVATYRRKPAEAAAGSAAPGLTGSIQPEGGSGSGNDGSGDLRAKFDCPACMPEDLPYCDHRPDALPLARVLASHFQGVAEPSREQMGWFLDDAGSLLKDAGPGPYAVHKLGEGWHSEHAFLLNNLVVTLGEGGKDCPAQPEVAAVLPEGHVLVPVSVDDDTVERVARALHDRECGDPDEVCTEFEAHGMWYVGSARAAVQALRDGGTA